MCFNINEDAPEDAPEDASGDAADKVPKPLPENVEIIEGYLRRTLVRNEDFAAGELQVKYCEDAIASYIGIATLGASVSFVMMVTQFHSGPGPKPKPGSVTNSGLDPRSPFNKSHTPKFLAIAWLFFVITLGFGSFCASLLNYHRASLKGEFGEEKKVTALRWCLGLGLLLVDQAQIYRQTLLLMVGFLFQALVILGYQVIIGSLAIAALGVAAVAAIVLFFLKLRHLRRTGFLTKTAQRKQK